MILQGKGFFTIDLSECEGGQPAAILAAAQAAGLSHVFVKIADGVKAAGIDAAEVDLTAAVVQALHAAGIAVWGWHYIYGGDPAAEAAIAITRTQALNLDGYAAYAGEEYQQAGMSGAAHQFMTALRAALKLPVALSSYRFPNYHPVFPWSTFLPFCDLYMPQVYWEQAHNAGVQLRESMRQCEALPNARPVIPIGGTYGTPAWNPAVEDINDFLQTAKDLGLAGVDFFDWAACRTQLPLLWKAITGFARPTALPDSLPVPDPLPMPDNLPLPDSLPIPDGLHTPDSLPTPNSLPIPDSLPAPEAPPVLSPDAFASLFLAALNSRDPAQVAALYDPSASQVWANQVQRSLASIQAGFVAFFASLPAGAVFKLSNAQIEGNTHTVVWKAGPLHGETMAVLKDGKIILDYTFIS